jgi:hypothetical protein
MNIAHLDELVATEYLKSRRKRANELLVHDLKCETEELNARVALATARKAFADFVPLPPTEPAQASAPSTGLTPPEVDELVATMPDISEDARRTLSLLLSGRVKEKNS